MTAIRIALITTLAMMAFAANSLLCREALAPGHIDAQTFTLVRIVSGAVFLFPVLYRQGKGSVEGNWLSAMALFIYAAAFSFAYLRLTAATGALLLFGAVQATMITHSLWGGVRLSVSQVIGVSAAGAGLIWLLLPGVASPSPVGTGLMIVSGIAWGIYSIRGAGTRDATKATAGNFLRAVPFALALYLLVHTPGPRSGIGIVYAVASGALASALGYALWYSVLPYLRGTTAATVQLSVPVIAALGGVLLLGESLSLRFVLGSAAVLGGIGMFLAGRGGQEARTTVPAHLPSGLKADRDEIE